MMPEQRQQRMAELVRETGSVTVPELEEEFEVSAATARRDLAVLERQGKVKRTHGGAVLPGLTQHEDSFQQRLGEAVEAKKRLARAATALLGEDESIFCRLVNHGVLCGAAHTRRRFTDNVLD